MKTHVTAGNVCRLPDLVSGLHERREGEDLLQQSEPRRHVAPRQWGHLKQSAGLAGWDKFSLQLFFVTLNITIFIFVVSLNLDDVEHLFCSTVGV